MSILVATNFSNLSYNAVLYSASLAKELKTKLILFNAFQVPDHASTARLSGTFVEGLIKKNRSRLKEMALDLIKKFDIQVEYKCKYVSLDQEVDRLMKAFNCRFLVIGMSSKSIEQNLLGNPATTLISMKRFPVLAVPIEAKFTGIKNILFACDLLQDIPLKTLAKLRDLAIRLKSEVTVFYVEQKITELKTLTQDEINNELEDVTILYKNVKSNTVIEAIEKEITKSNSDLLVMIPKKYGFWESIIHKSKTRVMASGLNIPLFSIPIE
ncbi:universal stress protein family protein [Mariniflexile fucanivorans]|uniref:Universal stress protein family protein n=1 Tax=Mariniflexile fucanivorans TaxID=264023 RepID=A0A4R1RLE2_9FLAO|nr:universal stress protein [Mariniflexile fucanivorans]TCL66916.1 universal stress protein family protein [Mariniflexile fucanivorans]